MKILIKLTIGMVLLISICGLSDTLGVDTPAKVNIVIPDYKVTNFEAVDEVEIPEGEILIVEEGRPKVPFYRKKFNYPQGWRIQEIHLLEKSGLKKSMGLKLPVVITGTRPELPVEMKKGWYPLKDFSWKLWENHDGSTTLDVSIYPFFYNPETTEVKFYTNYLFAIDYILSTFTIEKIKTDKEVYLPGEKIIFEVDIYNNGEEKDVVLESVVKRYGSEEIVAGLPLRMLEKVIGNSSVSQEWDSSGFEEGSFYLETLLRDTTGNVLAKKYENIALVSFVPELTFDEPSKDGKEQKPATNRKIIYIVLAVVVLLVIGVILKKKKYRVK